MPNIATNHAITYTNLLRACLHEVGDHGWGWFLLFSRSGGHKTKETYPTRPGSPTPCKQGLRQELQNKLFQRFISYISNA